MEIINKIGKRRIERIIFDFCLGLSITGIFEFFYIWFFRYEISDYLRFTKSYGFTDFFVQFIQVYSVLFVPLIVFLGFKYRNSVKFNSKNIKILINLLLIFCFSLLIFFYHGYALWQWAFLFIPIFILISLRFNLIFAFSFSYLSFYCANMLFEMQGLNFLHNFGTLLANILVYGIFILVLIKLKIKIDLSIILSFIPIIFLWVLTYHIWQIKGDDFYILFNPIDLYVRLLTFPFFLIITLKVYFTYRKRIKSYIVSQPI